MTAANRATRRIHFGSGFFLRARSAHTAIPFFAASGARAAADIFAIFFHTPPPSHKATNHAPGSRCTIHSLTRHHLVASQVITARPAPDPVLFLFILGTCSFFTHIPQSGILASQHFHAPLHGSFTQFPHIIHTQRLPRRHKKNPGSLILPGFRLWSKWRDSNPRPFGPEPLTHQRHRFYKHGI